VTRHRRCIACFGFLADHTPNRLVERGFRDHAYDPGERRQGSEHRARRVVWSDQRRARRAAA
jgi:hypothetical protein